MKTYSGKGKNTQSAASGATTDTYAGPSMHTKRKKMGR